MRGFLILLIVVGLGYLFLRQKQHEKSATAGRPMAAQSVAAPPPALTPAPRGQASEYNYMKRALDRAQDVRDHSRARTQADQDPN
jgi:hypothetical protein